MLYEVITFHVVRYGKIARRQGRDGLLHETDPGRRGRPRSRLFVSQGTLLVVSHPGYGDQLRNKPDEPGILEIVGGACFAGNRTAKGLGASYNFV